MVKVTHQCICPLSYVSVLHIRYHIGLDHRCENATYVIKSNNAINNGWRRVRWLGFLSHWRKTYTTSVFLHNCLKFKLCRVSAVTPALVWNRENSWSIYSGFSCDVISSKFCKSSYPRLPCWFPVHTGRYWEKQQNVPLFFMYFIPHYQITTEWQEYQHTLGWKFKSYHEGNQKFKCFLLLFSTKGYQEVLQNRVCISAYSIVQTLYCRDVLNLKLQQCSSTLLLF